MKLITKIKFPFEFSKVYHNSEENESIRNRDMVLEVCDDTMNFINQVAIIENEGFGKKVYKINGLEFREFYDLNCEHGYYVLTNENIKICKLCGFEELYKEDY